MEYKINVDYLSCIPCLKKDDIYLIIKNHFVTGPPCLPSCMPPSGLTAGDLPGVRGGGGAAGAAGGSLAENCQDGGG